MGFNASVAGYADAGQMVSAMMASEAAPLAAMARFIQAGQLDRPLRSHDWPSFARGYNGPDCLVNSYDTRLAAAYQRCLHGALPDLAVRATQVFLLYLGYQPGPVDGVMGRFTRSAMNEFQASNGLALTSNVDEATSQALRQTAVGG